MRNLIGIGQCLMQIRIRLFKMLHASVTCVCCLMINDITVTVLLFFGNFLGIIKYHNHLFQKHITKINIL